MKMGGGKDRSKHRGEPIKAVAPVASIKEQVILVIDDDVAILRMVKKILELEGLRVEVAKNTTDGFEKFSRFRPALVLLDVNLNEVETGFDICARLKQLFVEDADKSIESRSDENNSFVSIVFLTALASGDDVRHAAKVGGDGYIAKPFTTETLLAKVYYYLDKASRQGTVAP